MRQVRKEQLQKLADIASAKAKEVAPHMVDAVADKAKQLAPLVAK